MAVLLVAAAVWGYQMTPTSVPCASLRYIIEDQDERMYLSEGELTYLLKEQNCYPVGHPLDRVSLHRIETVVSSHPMVRTAECYLTPRHEVRILLTQRVPLLRVLTPGDTYFIDTDRRVMPVRSSVKDSVLVAKGAVGIQIASGALADFAEWLQDEPFWRTRVRFVQVQNPRKVYLYLRGENQPRILLGPLSGYERKLAKLHTFFEQGADATKDKQYIELDLRFKGQVIGRW